MVIKLKLKHRSAHTKILILVLAKNERRLEFRLCVNVGCDKRDTLRLSRHPTSTLEFDSELRVHSFSPRPPLPIFRKQQLLTTTAPLIRKANQIIATKRLFAFSLPSRAARLSSPTGLDGFSGREALRAFTHLAFCLRTAVNTLAHYNLTQTTWLLN